MGNFLLELDVSASFGSVAPTLEVWLDGVMISAETINAETGSGIRSLSYNLNYTGTYPQSLQFRFGGDTTGSLITMENISVNGVDVQSKRVNGRGRISKTKYDNDIAMGEAVALRIKDSDVLDAFDTPVPSAPVIASASWDPETGPTTGDLDAVTVSGTAGDDSLSGYMYNNDVIDGGAGNDDIHGEQGNDQIIGGAGDDVITGNDGDDVVIGGADNDTISGGDGADQLYGNDGNDNAEARAKLEKLKGKTHQLISSVSIAQNGKILWRECDTASLTMHDFDDAFFDEYLHNAGEDILACVGAYAFEKHGAWLFKEIDANYFTILGMPLLPLLAYLAKA